jgi:hypothetical protein
MRLLILVMLVVFVSCNQTDKKNITGASEDLFIEVIKSYIVEDSLYKTEIISPRLYPYIYYPTQYTEDGLEIPSPPIFYEGEYIDENKIIERIGHQKYFSEKDRDHLKYQIISSKEISNTIYTSKLSKMDRLKAEDITTWYMFYVPSFNSDSSAVYVQYDYHDGSYGEGNGALLIKNNGQWKLIDWFDRWIT